MNTYKRHRFPPEIISYAVWLYYRSNHSHRDLEDLLAERGVTVSREAEQSHEATRVRERGMRKFKAVKQAQGFLGAHAAVSNLVNLGRHRVRAKHYRGLRVSAFTEWSKAVA